MKADRLKLLLRNAEEIGYTRGLADQHHEKRTFETGAEYTAWLRGWRRGQAEYKGQAEQVERMQMATERTMRSMLRRVG